MGDAVSDEFVLDVVVGLVLERKLLIAARLSRATFERHQIDNLHKHSEVWKGRYRTNRLPNRLYLQKAIEVNVN